jgi:Protein of unknown function (DUF2459)
MMRGWKQRCAIGWLAASLVAAPCPGVAQSSPAPQDPAVIYVARRGWHIDIGFPAADLRPPLTSLLNEFPGARYLFFGFGDRRYLLAKHHHASGLLAALWPGRGLILATGLISAPPGAFGERYVAALRVTPRQASDAQAFVWQSLEKQFEDGTVKPQSEDGSVKSYAPGPYEGSVFFDATPKYSAIHTCNTWAAEVLAAGALPIRSAGVVFAGQLWKEVRRLEAQRQGGLLPSSQTTVVPEF